MNAFDSALGGGVWRLMQSGAGRPAWNMAVDEALLLGAPAIGHPVLRFYSWEIPAATFGYSQPIAEVEAMTPLRPLVRRTTGGGLVPHDADWTYSLVFPPSHAWYSLRAEESYRRLHEWIRDSFPALGVGVELSPCCAKELPGQCFAGPEKFDLLWSGHKIAGAAQRRSRQGLLIQGSLQRQPAGVERAAWERSFSATAESAFGIRWEPLEWTPALESDAAGLEREKYSRDGYNRKR
jgi:lipoate-protein ligase A